MALTPYEPDFDPNSLQAGTTLQQMSSTMDPITPTRFAHIAIKSITIVPTGSFPSFSQDFTTSDFQRRPPGRLCGFELTAGAAQE